VMCSLTSTTEERSNFRRAEGILVSCFCIPCTSCSWQEKPASYRPLYFFNTQYAGIVVGTALAAVRFSPIGIFASGINADGRTPARGVPTNEYRSTQKLESGRCEAIKKHAPSKSLAGQTHQLDEGTSISSRIYAELKPVVPPLLSLSDAEHNCLYND
jgi:hypothetical protein